MQAARRSPWPSGTPDRCTARVTTHGRWRAGDKSTLYRVDACEGHKGGLVAPIESSVIKEESLAFS